MLTFGVEWIFPLVFCVILAIGDRLIPASRYPRGLDKVELTFLFLGLVAAGWLIGFQLVDFWPSDTWIPQGQLLVVPVVLAALVDWWVWRQVCRRPERAQLKAESTNVTIKS